MINDIPDTNVWHLKEYKCSEGRKCTAGPAIITDMQVMCVNIVKHELA